VHAARLAARPGTEPQAARDQEPDMPTMGRLRCTAPVEPSNTASPNVKIPPSAATRRYPAGGSIVRSSVIAAWLVCPVRRT